MSKRWLVVVVLVVISLKQFAQNLTISGGSMHSVMICGKGLVYAWGNNKDVTNNLNNLLGLKDATKATLANITTPSEVSLPTGITFKQVDAGSGAFNIALGCNNVVYMWGENLKKECGQGNTAATSYSTPVPVLKGQTSGSTMPGMSNYLGNVTYVSASTSTAYAILSDKRVVAWGSNAYKQLGNPTITAPEWGEPVYMKMKTSSTAAVTDLTNCIFLDAGDEQVIALVDDGVIGDGVGTVYSCGGSAYNQAELVLGRDATINGVFMPVLKQDGTPLTNVKMVSAGDSHGIAVDATTGYVWSWGNDGWGCITGTTFPNPSTAGTRASRVVSGEYKTITGLDYLTNIKQVSGGRGFTVAVTNDGYVLSWGNNENNGGNLGSGSAATNSCATGPQFVRYASTTLPVTDGVSVSDGDNWGFLINKNNQFFAWGFNEKGQLGDGSVITRNMAVPITNNIPCQIPNPCPKADMPPYYNVCPGQTFGLYAGFAPPTGQTANYSYKWYYGTSMTGPWTALTGTTQTINVSTIGWYKVEISYMGTDIPCDACETSIDVVELRAIEANFYDPAKDGDTLFYCGTSADVHIKQKTAAPTDKYKWYSTLTSTTELGATTGTGVATIPTASMTSIITDSVYQVWAQDVSSFLVTVAKETGVFANAFVKKETYGVQKANSEITFTLTGTVTLKKVKFRQPAYGATVIDIVISGGTLAAPVNVTTGDNPSGANGAWVAVTADFNNLVLGPGTYSLINNKDMELWNGDNTATLFPFSFDPNGFFINNGRVVKDYGYTNRYPGWFDFEFESGSNYPCGRVPVLVYKKCPPCIPVNSADLPLTITTSPTDLSICPSETATLTSKTFRAAKTGGKFDFIWYKGTSTTGTVVKQTLTTVTATNYSDNYTVPYTDPGLYTLLVRDHDKPTSVDCQYIANVTIAASVKPTYTITGGGAYCSNATVPPVTITLDGVAPFSLTWIDGTTPTTQTGITTSAYSVTPTSGTVTLTALNDNYCTGTVDATKNAKVTKITQPDFSWDTTTDTIYCEGNNTASLKAVPNTADPNYSFEWRNITTGTPGTVITGVNAATITSSSLANGKYQLVVSNSDMPANTKTCTQILKPRTIQANPLPTYTVTGTATYCSNDNVNAVVFTIGNGIPPYSLTYKDGGGTSHTVTVGTATSTNPVTFTALEKMAGTYSVVSLSDNSQDKCAAQIIASEKAIITINQSPTYTSVNQINCEGVANKISLPGIFTFTPSGGTATYSCTNDATAVTLEDFTKGNTAGDYYIKAKYTINGCSVDAFDTITVHANPVVNAGIDASACVNVAIAVNSTVTKGSTPYKYKWTPATNLSADNIANPVFNSSNPVSTTYTVSVSDKYGCSGTDDIVLTATGLPTVTANSTKSAICIGETTTVNGSGAVNYSWSNAGSTATVAVTPTTTTSYIVTGTDANGCKNTASTSVTVNKLPSITAAASPSAICIGKSTTVSATGATTYSWNIPVGTVSPRSTTTYTVTGTDINSCSNTASVIVTVNQLPDISASTTPAQICIGSNTTIKASGGVNYVWNDATIGTAATQDITPAVSTIYIVTGTDANLCVNSASVSVTVNTLPTITTSISKTPICIGESISITGGGATNYLWSNNQNSQKITISPTANTSYVVTGVDVNGCINTTSTTVIVNPLPTISLSLTNNAICVSKSTSISASGASSYVWNPSTITGIGGIINPAISTTYSVTGTSSDNCVNTASIVLTVNTLPTVTWSASNKHLVCNDGGVETLALNVNPAGGVGTFTLIPGLTKNSETTALFDPTLAGTGHKDLQYTYRDLNTCETTVTPDTIHVFDTPEPTVLNLDVMSNPIPQTSAITFDVSADGFKNVKWYKDPKDATVLGYGNSFAPVIGGAYPNVPKVPTNDSLVANTYTYNYTQTINGCESKPVNAVLTVTSCPAPAPTAGIDPKPCTASTLSVQLSATPNGTGTLHWFDGSNPKLATKLAGPTNSFTSTVTTPGNVCYYVAEYDALKTCYGPTTPVCVTINPLPTPSVTPDKTSICNTDNLMNIGLNPSINAKSSLVCSNAAMLDVNNKFVPNGVPNTSGNYTLTYSYTDANNCSATAIATVAVNYTAPPVAQTDLNVLASTIPIPQTVKVTATGTDLKWYEDADAKVSITGGTGTPFDTKMDASGVTSTVSKNDCFYATQTLNGCESKTDTVCVTIVDCPWLKPKVDNLTICENDLSLPTTAMNATIPTQTPQPNATVATWEWFSDASMLNKVASADSYTVTDATPGTFKYYVRYKEVEPNSNVACWSQVSEVTRLVYAKPTPVITPDQKDVCNTVSSMNITLAPSINASSSLTCSTPSMLDANNKFLPGAAGEKSDVYTLTYNYTDLATTCKNTTTTTINVYYTAPPAAQNDASVLAKTLTYPQTVKVTAKGTDLKWYNDAAAQVAISGGVGATLDTKMDSTGVTVLVPKNKCFYVTQTENNCESKTDDVCVSIVSCPWGQPSVVGVEFCEDDSQLSQNPLKANTSETGVNWQWYNDINANDPIALATSNSYVPTAIAPGKYEYFVRYEKLETISNTKCWSPITKVVRQINPKPNAVIDASVLSDYCYTEPSINLKGNDALAIAGTDKFIVDGAVNASSVITVGSLTQNKSYVLDYIRTTDKGCDDTAHKTITVHYIAPPVVSGNCKVIGVPGPMPKVSAIITGVGVQWYNASSVAIAGAAGKALEYSYPNAEPNANTVVNYSATQEDAYGCVSQKALTSLCFNLCGALAPSANGKNMCLYDSIPTFNFTRTSVNNHQYRFRVYDKSPYDYANTATKVDSGKMSFNPKNYLIPLTAGHHQFWVAEYDIDDNCMGPGTNFILQVNSTQPPIPEPTIAACEGTINGFNVLVAANSVLSGADVYWYESTANTVAEESTSGKIGKGIVFKYTNDLNPGSHTLLVSQFKQCQSEKVPVIFTINPKPTEPLLDSNFSCQGLQYKSLKATASENTNTISWYDNSLLLGNAIQGLTFTPNALTPGEKMFYATQTTRFGCTSDAAAVKYILYPEPPKPIIVSTKNTICDYDSNIPTYSVTNAVGKVTWTDNGANSEGVSYVPQKPAAGFYSTSFSVLQEKNGCISESAISTLYLVKKPDKPVYSNQTICSISQPKAFETVPVGTNVIKWYTSSSDVGTNNNTQSLKFTPVNYKIPQTAGSQDETTTFYATQTTVGSAQCESDPASFKLIVKASPLPPKLDEYNLLACANDEAMKPLFATSNVPGATYQWYVADSKLPVISEDGTIMGPGGNTFYPNAKKYISPRATVSFDVTVKNGTGCISEPVKGTYHVSKTIMNPILISDANPYCFEKGKSKLFEIFAQGSNFKWYVNDKLVDDAINKQSMSFIPDTTGQYSIRFTQELIYSVFGLSESISCGGNDYSFTQLVKPVPHVDVYGDSLICENTTKISYAAIPSDSTDAIKWTITNGRTMYSPTVGKSAEFVRQIDFADPGFDTLVVTEHNGQCGYSDTLFIQVSPRAIPDFKWEVVPGTRKVEFINTTERPQINQNEEKDTVDFNYFKWNLGIENAKPYKQSYEHYLNDSAIYQIYKYGYFDVKLNSYNEYCNDSVTKKIFVDINVGLYLPNSFIPESNSPGLSRFQPKGYNLETYKIWIYDTWGNLLWYSDKLVNGSPSESWDGTYEGIVLKTDVYIWKVEATFQDGTEWEGQRTTNDGKKKTFGNVLLLR